MEERYYRTAAFARLAGMNKKTLQYYDEIGLFHPARVEENGYRYYSIFQFDRLALIATLKDLGLPLKEIKRYLDSGDLGLMDQLLDRQGRELERRLEQLTRRRAMLERMRRENQEFLLHCGRGPRRLHREEERAAVLLGPEEMKPGQQVIINYLTDGPGTGLCCDGEQKFLYQRRPDGPILLPGGEYLCLFESSTQPLHAWMEGCRERLEEYAAVQGLELEDRAFAEFNELSVNPQEPSTEALRVMRMRILE